MLGLEAGLGLGKSQGSVEALEERGSGLNGVVAVQRTQVVNSTNNEEGIELGTEGSSKAQAVLKGDPGEAAGASGRALDTRWLLEFLSPRQQ